MTRNCLDRIVFNIHQFPWKSQNTASDPLSSLCLSPPPPNPPLPSPPLRTNAAVPPVPSVRGKSSYLYFLDFCIALLFQGCKLSGLRMSRLCVCVCVCVCARARACVRARARARARACLCARAYGTNEPMARFLRLVCAFFSLCLLLYKRTHSII